MHDHARCRHGSRLEHGEAHTEDHARWSRRDFLAQMGLATAGVGFTLGGLPIHAFGRAPLLQHLGQQETDRVLVILQMAGGNDGLNTIIPFTNDIYYRERPTLAIPRADGLSLDPDTGLHPAMQPGLEPLWATGQMAVVHNVGYAQSTRSHFEGTINWVSARDQGQAEGTGWAGRYLASEFLGGEPLDYPLAVRVGGAPASLFLSDQGNLGVTFADASQFERFVLQGGYYDADTVPATVYGEALSFVRDVTNASFRFVASVQNAADQTQNLTSYPNSSLASSLSVVARLIRGRLGSRIFAVSQGGFDTHSEQGGTAGRHASRLETIAGAIAAFYEDLAVDGLQESVIVMTFSEFGRTLTENGSFGTDHGAGAPLLLFGPGLGGGLYGSASPLTPDSLYNDDPRYTTDYRSVYATLLQDWFGLPPERISDILGQEFATLGFVDATFPVSREPAVVPADFEIAQNYPNPFSHETTIRYTLYRSGVVRLGVYDVQGRLLRTLVDRLHPVGTFEVSFAASGLPSGTYLYRLETNTTMQTRRMVVVR